MRVLEVLGSSGGGVVRHVGELVAGLVAEADQVVVAGPGATLARASLPSTARAVSLEIADRPRPLRDLGAVLALRRLAAGADLVHAHGLRAGALAVLAARTRRRRPHVTVTLHNLPVGGRAVTAVSAVLERVVARGADDVLVVSADLGDRVRARGARRVERALVPAPLRPATAPATRASLRADLLAGPPPGDAARSLVVCVARLAPQKGLPAFLDAVALLQAHGVSVRAVLVGDGPLHEPLAADVAGRALPVRLLGARDDANDLIAAADVVVLPSIWEGQPLVAQEALRAGAALVATDVGGTREVTGDAAVLVPRTTPAGTARDLADAVQRLLEQSGEAAALRRRAVRRAAELPTAADAVAQVRARLGGSSTGTPGSR